MIGSGEGRGNVVYFSEDNCTSDWKEVTLYCPKCKHELEEPLYRAKELVEMCQLRKAYLETYKTNETEIQILKKKVAELEATKEDWSDF